MPSSRERDMIVLISWKAPSKMRSAMVGVLSRISIAAERPFEVYGDGERIGPLRATFRVVPRALSVVAPAR